MHSFHTWGLTDGSAGMVAQVKALAVALGSQAEMKTVTVKARFAVHAVPKQALEQARQRFATRFAAYPDPKLAVLIGGSTNKYRLTREAMAQLILALQRLLNRMEGSLLMTASRRTGEENVA